MAKNPYFSDSTSEQKLIEDLTEETIRSMGREVYYIPRTLINKDPIFGEDTLSQFNTSYKIEMYVNSAGGFEGQGDIVSKFGIEIKDRVELVLSKRRFSDLITRADADLDRPTEGDLVYFSDSDTLFEINFVEHENPFYPLGKLYTYVLTCEAFSYSYETINTGESFIDDITDDFTSNGFEVSMSSIRLPDTFAGSGASSGYSAGEPLYQIIGNPFVGGTANTIGAADGVGIIYDFMSLVNPPEGTCGDRLLVGDQAGGFNLVAGEYLIGASSGSIGMIATVERTGIVFPATPEGRKLKYLDNGTPYVDTSSELLDNTGINEIKDADDIFNFTDIDPFSEGRY
tara:strand:+ start:569 stop:1597 length:1029 start_codon:yes stop_codon:yes gene_type:complete